MHPVQLIIWLILAASTAGILIFFSYPILILAMSGFFKQSMPKNSEKVWPDVTLLVVARNAQNLIRDKIKNSLAIDYPATRLDILVVSDGSTDNTVPELRGMPGERMTFFDASPHLGKSMAINTHIHRCCGDIVVFSDVDALIEPGAVKKLVRHFANPAIGGVCGQRSVQKDITNITRPQKGYIKFDSLIKKLETRSGSITSNDGKLFAIRKKLFLPIEDGVTDDMFIMLGVIRQDYSFVFEPDAIAFIKAPSRDARHEVERRIRITTGSLNGIRHHRVLMNPFKYGSFSLKLAINKVIRRLIPLCLMTIFLCSAVLSFYSLFMATILLLQVAGYGLALGYGTMPRLFRKNKAGARIGSLLWYFCLGNYGQLLGLIRLAQNKPVTKWEPKKE